MINNVILVGRLTKEPNLQTTVNGRKSTFINIAITNYSEHQKKNTTNYVSLKLWGKTAEYAARKAKKGMEVSVSGLVRTSSYINDNEKQVYVTEIIVERFHLLTGQFEEFTQNAITSTSDTSDFEQFVKALQ